jgi:iron complex outermembrane receptor protein
VGFADEENDAYGGGTTYNAHVPDLGITTITGFFAPGYKQQREYWAEANWNVGPATITYLPAYRTWQQRDTQLVSPNFIESGDPLVQQFLTPQDTFNTQELRVASKDGSAVQWLAGAFYYHNVLHNTNHNALQTPSGEEQAVLSDTVDSKDTDDLGYFAETTIPLMSSLRMTLGARYDDTRVIVGEYFYDDAYGLCGTSFATTMPFLIPPPGPSSCTGPGTSTAPSAPGVSISGLELNFHEFNYKTRLEYDLTPKNMLYGMLSTGFLPGDAGVSASTREANIVGAEKLTSIEAGSKNRFLDDSLQLNVGVFFYNYHAFQTSYATCLAINCSIAVNVPAHNIGSEAELQYRLTAHDRINLNYNYVQSRWYDKPAGFAYYQPERDRAMTPNTVTGDYEHVFDLSGGSTFTARIDGRYQSAHLSGNLNVLWLNLGYGQYAQLPSQTTGNLTGTWTSEGGRYSISAYVRNFTNEQYKTYSVTDLVELPVTFSDPRTYGAMASARF